MLSPISGKILSTSLAPIKYADQLSEDGDLKKASKYQTSGRLGLNIISKPKAGLKEVLSGVKFSNEAEVDKDSAFENDIDFEDDADMRRCVGCKNSLSGRSDCWQ